MGDPNSRDRVIAFKCKIDRIAHHIRNLVGILNHQFQDIILQSDQQSSMDFYNLADAAALVDAYISYDFVVFEYVDGRCGDKDHSVAKE